MAASSAIVFTTLSVDELRTLVREVVSEEMQRVFDPKPVGRSQWDVAIHLEWFHPCEGLLALIADLRGGSP